MAEHSLWTCDRCRHTARVKAGGKPAFWGTVTVAKMRRSPHWRNDGNPETRDLCGGCYAAVDALLRDRAATVERPTSPKPPPSSPPAPGEPTMDLAETDTRG